MRYLHDRPILINLGPRPFQRHCSSVAGLRFKKSAAWGVVRIGGGAVLVLVLQFCSSMFELLFHVCSLGKGVLLCKDPFPVLCSIENRVEHREHGISWPPQGRQTLVKRGSNIYQNQVKSG